MWIPAAVRRRILAYLFKNGVLVVSDNQAGEHEELGCLNIYCFQIGRSFTDKGFTKKRYAWVHAYFTVTDKGIDYLRGYFGAGPEVVPATLTPRTAEVLADARRAEGGRGGFRGGGRGGQFRGGRGGFRDRDRPPREGGDRPPRDGGDRPPREGGDRPPRAGGFRHYGRGQAADAPAAASPE
jgi:small subunit ribosomal protein S10e